ncbi:response regulator [Flavobacteriales bacterium]|nr:response regulator [Flavobacteriales bacterium]
MAKRGVYCIDDDRTLNIVLKHHMQEVLDDNDFLLEVFDDPKDALIEIEENHKEGIVPLVCIVDFQMPEMRGDEFIRKIKKMYPFVKCIMLSGNSLATVVSDLEEDNLLEFYLSKPWVKADLHNKFNKCLPLNLKFA